MNASTLIVALIVFGVFAAIVIKGIRDHRSGKSSCSCGCAGCTGGPDCCGAAGNGASKNQK